MTDDVGLLYVLANRDSSLAKIGMTRNGTPNTRATDYERKHGIAWRVFWQARTERVAGTRRPFITSWRLTGSR